MIIKNEYNSSTLYTLTRDVVCFTWTRSHWILYCQRCLYT